MNRYSRSRYNDLVGSAGGSSVVRCFIAGSNLPAKFCSLCRWLLMAAALAWSAYATDLWGATLHVPAEFPSIQAAHDAAVSGDTILVAPGTYFGQITITKAITLASHFLPTGDESFIGTTVLDGDGRAFVIEIPANAEDRPTIQGFTIQNSEDGILPYAMFNLLNCLVRDTSDGVDYEDGSGGLVQFCTFEYNSDDGIDLDNAVDIVIADNTIRYNDDDGIEIRMQDYFTGPTKNIIITRNAIYGNGEDGIQLIHYNELTNRFFEITYNIIYDNVDAGIGMMDGGETSEDFRAASIPETIYIFSNTFSNNSHGISGGDNTVVLNNIFVDHAMIAVKNVDANSELAHNLFFNNGTDNSGSNVDPGTSVFSDPLLDSNFGLQLGSPAIDAGTALYIWQEITVLSLPPDAFSGTAPDIGALEFESGAPTPDINLNPAALDFGVVTIGGSNTLSADIENLGNADLTVTNIALAGGTSGEFSFTAPVTPFTIPAGGSQAVTVTYKPVDVGLETGGLAIANDDPDEPGVTLGLSGTGEEAALDLDLDIAQIKVTKQVRLARVKPVRITLVVRNNGAVNSAERQATVIGIQNGVEVYNETMMVSDPVEGGSTQFPFPAYTPTEAGDIMWTATIADDDPDIDEATAVTTVN